LSVIGNVAAVTVFSELTFLFLLLAIVRFQTSVLGYAEVSGFDRLFCKREGNNSRVCVTAPVVVNPIREFGKMMLMHRVVQSLAERDV
jgi:hypothetical protein